MYDNRRNTPVFFVLPACPLLCYNARVNVPAARMVAKRPSLVTWRYNVWLHAAPKREPQVAAQLPVFDRLYQITETG
jgi:hypothetical protein